MHIICLSIFLLPFAFALFMFFSWAIYTSSSWSYMAPFTMNADVLYMLLKFDNVETPLVTLITQYFTTWNLSYEIRFGSWFSHVFILYSWRSLTFSWLEFLSSYLVLDSSRGIKMRSGCSETYVPCSFQGDNNDLDVFPLRILGSLRFLKLCSQWLHLKSCSEIVGTTGKNGTVAGLVEVCPKGIHPRKK